MLTIYEAIQDEVADRKRGESSEISLWQKHHPVVGDEVLMGCDRRWVVVSVESYHSASDFIFVAMVHPLGLPVPEPETRRAQIRLDFSPSVSRYLELSPSKYCLSEGWMMDGSAPGGRLMNYFPTTHPTLQREEPSDWGVDKVDAYLPFESTNSYSAIHLCWCKELAATARLSTAA
jgi:hypothetical protein